MIAYIFIYLYALFALIVSFTNKKNNLFYMGLLTIVLVFISGFRYGVGMDYHPYEWVMGAIINDGNVHTRIGYRSFVLLLDSLGFSYQAIFFTMAFVTVSLFMMFYYRYSKYPLLSSFLFVTMPILYLYTMNSARQFLAAGIFTIGLKYIIERNLFPYLITIIIASLFHKSAILLLPLYFILHKKASILLYLITAIFYFSILLFAEPIAKYVGISLSYFYFYENIAVSLKAYVFLFIFLFVYLLKDKLIKVDRINTVFINMLFIAILISFTPVISNFPTVPILRLNTYFLFVIPIVMANILYVLSNRTLKYLFLITLVSLSSMYYLNTLLLKGDYYKLTPYKMNVNIRK